MMNPEDRYDSLIQFWSVMDQTRDGRWVERPTPLDWRVVKRQMLAESGGNPDAVSRVGAKGLMQFMDKTWEEWVRNEFGGDPLPRRYVNQFDPEDSIRAACDMMAWLLRVWNGDWRKALASYNWGVGNVQRAVQRWGEQWEDHAPRETRDYVRRILREG
jgi:soluble lytic murein transglycosylase-like protein